jgi:hypothetical protein
MLRKLIAILILVAWWICLDYALLHAEDITTAGQTHADTEPFYKGATQ